MTKEILIIENEGLIAGLLRRALQQKGFTITSVDPEDAPRRIRRRGTSLVLWEAPNTSAESVRSCRFLRDLTTAPFVALVESDTGEILLRAGGGSGPQMRRILWDTQAFRGRSVFIKIVDRNIGSWGHLTFDDFSIEGTLH